MKLKWVLTGLAALVVAVLVAGYAVLANFDVEQYRDEIQARAKAATGRDLVLAGPIDLRISLTPAITAEDVRFSNAAWGSQPDMVLLQRFELEVALLPLLSQELQVKRLVLVEPKVLLETDGEGRGNWVLGPDAASAPENAGGSDLRALQIDAVELEGGMLVIRDSVSGITQQISLEALQVTGVGDRSLDLAMTGAFQDVAFSVAGEVGAPRLLQTGPYPLAVTATLGGAEVAVEGVLGRPMTGNGIDLKVTAKGDDLAGLGALAGAALPAMGAFEANFSVTGDSEQVSISDLNAKAGTSTVAGNLTVAPSDADAPVKALDLRLATRGESLAELNALVGDGLPAVGPYDVALTLGLDGPAITFTDLVAKLGQSDIAGQGRVLISAVPQLQGTFTSTLLDLDELTKTAEGEGGGGDSPFVFDPEPLPLELLELVNAEIGLVAQQVRLPDGLQVSDLDLTLVTQDGNLRLKPLTASLYGGRLDADVALEGGSKALKTTMNAKGVSYGQMLRDLQIEEQVEGTADVLLRLQGTGASLREIASTANGRWELVGGAGKIDNGLLEFLTAGLGDVLGPLLGNEEQSNLRCVVQHFAIKDGLATSEAIVVDTSGFTLTGGGTVDLKTEALNLTFETESHDASIASLAVPFQVSGTLASPSVAPDPLGTALEVAKTAGLYINPFVGIGVLVGENLLGRVTEDGNPCLEAIQQAESGAKPSQGVVEDAAEGAASAVEGAAEGAADAVEGAVEGIGEGLKSLFGD